MSQKNYYETLGINKDASVDEIKKAFRRKAVKHHPDQGGDEAKFKEINEAYEVLSNSEKRQRYDQFGAEGLGGAGGFRNAGGPTSGEGFSFDFGDGGLGDIFGSFFGAGRQGQASRSGRNVEVVIDLDFKEAVFGVEKEISLNLEDVCPQCKGERAQPGSKVGQCADCKGSGRHVRLVRTPFGNLQQQATCSTCRGEGSDIKESCTACRGQGVSQQKKTINLSIPAGIEDGATIRLRSHGERNRKGMAGDLYVIIQVQSDKHFTREGDLILSEETINMVEAALGTNIKIKTIDGTVMMKIPAGTQSGTDFRLAKQGVPHLKGSGRGAQIVRVIVKIPTKLNDKQKSLLKSLQETSLKK